MAPQSYQALLCVQCKAFQVHIVKKAKNWDCKLCGTKQSFQKIFATGSGTDCRIIVQKLNEARGEVEQTILNSSIKLDLNKAETPAVNSDNTEARTSQSKSKWAEYLEGNIEEVTEKGFSAIPNYLY